MNYIENYNTRISAKTHKTRLYSEEELSSVRRMIKRFLLDKNPHATLNTNEANYAELSEAVNEHYNEEVLTARFIYDIYLQNTDSQRKNVRKMNAITDFVKLYFRQKNPAMQAETVSETERLSLKIDALQQDVRMMLNMLQQHIVPRSTFAEASGSFAMTDWSQALLQQRA